MRNRHLLILAVLLMLLPLGGCEFGGGSDRSATDAAETLIEDVADIVSATGEVRPARRASLSLSMAGTVRAVHVDEGEAVTAGQRLVELEAVQLDRGVAEAEAALTAAEVDLQRIKAGAHPQDIAAAEQALAAAQANVGVSQAQVQVARAEESRAQTGVSAARTQVAIAEAGVDVAQAQLNQGQARARSEDLTRARAALDKAQAAVRLAQADYDRTDRSTDTPQALALEQATLDLKILQAEYDRLVSGARPVDLGPLQAGVESARAQVAAAEAQVVQAEAAAAQASVAVAQAEAAVLAAQAQVGQAQASLDRLRAGATAEEVAVAEAAVRRAQEAVVTAQALRDQATLTAPFDGTVGLILIQVGEEVMPGQAVMMLGDLGTLRVETTDLDEIDVARVQPGQQVDLTFDALPEKVLAGRVISIAPMSTLGQAATTFKVIVEFEETDPALRWGMTAFVDINLE